LKAVLVRGIFGYCGGARLIFKKFPANERIDKVADSLIDLLNRMENFKRKTG